MTHAMHSARGAVSRTKRMPPQRRSGSSKQIFVSFTMRFPSLWTRTAVGGIIDTCAAFQISLTQTAIKWAKPHTSLLTTWKGLKTHGGKRPFNFRSRSSRRARRATWFSALMMWLPMRWSLARFGQNPSAWPTNRNSGLRKWHRQRCHSVWRERCWNTTLQTSPQTAIGASCPWRMWKRTLVALRWIGCIWRNWTT